jgi:glutamine---fructose-6-phosphate transaminase (isomerizing)
VSGELMARDMAAQPAVLAELVRRREGIVSDLRRLAPAAPAGVVLVARGSSDYAAVFGRYAIEAAAGRPVALAAPSLHTLYGIDTDVRGWLAVGVSQSGRTPEIVTVLERLGAGGARTAAITNDGASPLARAAEVSVALGAGPEEAVPATKTFTAELAAFALVAEAVGSTGWSAADWEEVPAAVAAVLADSDSADAAARTLTDAPGLVCLARGYLLCVALEAALKLREAAALPAEGWSAADFRHGPIAASRREVPALALSASGAAAADVAALADRLRGWDVPLLELSDRPGAELPIPARPPEPLACLPAAVRAQQLALALARRRGVDPDRPAGLAKLTPTV